VNNYPNASLVIRNVSELTCEYEVILEDGLFRVIRLDPPFLHGSEFWIINERGFLWEPVDNFNAALLYLKSPEAIEYKAS
jgi:hypothetical protein